MLRTLECLVALVDHGSVSAAAGALHMSQPALSHQVASLERELGAPVVERLWRGVRVTAAGRATADEARVAIRAATQAIQIGRLVGSGGAGRLRISCVETMTAWPLVPVLALPPPRCSSGPVGVHEFRHVRLRPVVKRDVIAVVAAPSDRLVQQFVADIRRRGTPRWAGPTP
jgi:hypothetical protein